jgi:hypothetical protein
MVLQASQLHQPNPSTSERACIVGTTQNQPLPTTHPPTILSVATITNARHHKGVATAELLLTNRGRLPTSAVSAHFSLFSMASERRSKKNGGMRYGSLDSAMSGLPLPSAQPESVRDAQAVSANYGSDTTLVNSTCAGLLRLAID